jgi:hypothetical protein
MDGTLDLPFSVYRAFFYLRISRWSSDGVFVANKDVFTCERCANRVLCADSLGLTKVWSLFHQPCSPPFSLLFW